MVMLLYNNLSLDDPKTRAAINMKSSLANYSVKLMNHQHETIHQDIHNMLVTIQGSSEPGRERIIIFYYCSFVQVLIYSFCYVCFLIVDYRLC